MTEEGAGQPGAVAQRDQVPAASSRAAAGEESCAKRPRTLSLRGENKARRAVVAVGETGGSAVVTLPPPLLQFTLSWAELELPAVRTTLSRGARYPSAVGHVHTRCWERLRRSLRAPDAGRRLVPA